MEEDIVRKQQEGKEQKEGKGESRNNKNRKRIERKNEEDDEEEWVEGQKGDQIKPLKLDSLPKENEYKADDLILGQYALVQDKGTRYLVSIWERYGDKFEGHYLLSHEPQGPNRRYSKAFWDNNLGKIRLGAGKKKHNRIIPMCVSFEAKDVYYTF